MLNTLTRTELLAELKGLAAQHGLTAINDGATTLRGDREAIKAKWFLGGSKAVYNFSCRFDVATHTATFREAVLDRSWGIAPPSFKTERYSQSGTTVMSTREQKSMGGGGTLEFGQWREVCEQAVTRAGWHFNHEALRAP